MMEQIKITVNHTRNGRQFARGEILTADLRTVLGKVYALVIAEGNEYWFSPGFFVGVNVLRVSYPRRERPAPGQAEINFGGQTPKLKG